jgi:acyl-coenzyme A thioesterase PaaI-like protein
MSAFPPRTPDFAERVRRSFARQAMMRTIGAELVRVEPGEIEIAMPVAPHLCSSTASSMAARSPRSPTRPAATRALP